MSLEPIDEYAIECGDWVKWRLSSGQMVRAQINGYVLHYVKHGRQGRLFTILHHKQLIIVSPKDLFVYVKGEI